MQNDVYKYERRMKKIQEVFVNVTFFAGFTCPYSYGADKACMCTSAHTLHPSASVFLSSLHPGPSQILVRPLWPLGREDASRLPVPLFHRRPIPTQPLTRLSRTANWAPVNSPLQGGGGLTSGKHQPEEP